MTEVLAELLVPFSYEYMAKAMWVSALVGGVCAFLSAYLMLKGWSLMGDALAHSIVPGVAGAYILGLPFALGAFFAGILASVGMGFVKQHTRLREDAVIGLVFTSLFALGLLMASIWPTSVSIQTIVLGNILAISDEDVVQVAIISAVSLGILALKWKDLMVTFFDESHARSMGLNTGFLKGLFFTLLSACTVAALQTVGACLVIAMVVTPGATAYLLTDRFGRLIVISIAIGATTSFVGAYISYFLDGATGGVIVTLQALLFLGAFYFAPKHGMLAARRRQLATAEREHERRIRMDHGAAQLPVHAAGADRLGAGRRGLRRAVLLSRAQGLVADGGCHLPRGAARHRRSPMCSACRLRSARSRAGLSCALLTGYLKEHSRVKEDTVMGIVFSGMFGFGLVIFTKVETDQHLNHILFGNVLGVTVRDLVETAIIAGGTLLVVLLKRRDLLLYCFDPNHARAIGLPVRVLHYGLLILLSLTIVGALKAVGIILVIAMLVAPGAIAYLLTDSFERMLVIAAARRHRLERARNHRELPYRRCDRRLHRAHPVRGVRAGVPVRAEARPVVDLGPSHSGIGGPAASPELPS